MFTPQSRPFDESHQGRELAEASLQFYSMAMGYRDRLARINSRLREHGLRIESWLVMMALESGPASQTALIETTGVHKVGVSRSISELHDLDLVTKYICEQDNRRKYSALTDKGVAVLSETRRLMFSHIAGLETEQMIKTHAL